MASPADVVIKNKLGSSIKTRVIRNYWVEGDGSSIDDKVIGAGSSEVFSVKAKTGHHGELDVQLIRESDRQVLGTLYIKSIKDPQEGEALRSKIDYWGHNLQIASYGERHPYGHDRDLRRITFTLLEAKYSELHYNEVTMKSSHNSYERNESIIQQLKWVTGMPSNDGCGSLEIDVAQSDEGNEWAVSHVGNYNKKYRQLSQYLSDLTAYSTNNPGHDVVTLHIDLKKVCSDKFPEELDGYIRSRLCMPIYSPGDIMGDCLSLAEGARKNGWPTVDALKGKIIICLTGAEGFKKIYAETNPSSRLCFADKGMSVDEAPSGDHRIFFNYEIGQSSRDKWMKTFREAAGRKDALTRGYLVNSADSWYDCLESGATFIATDRIENHDWAKVGYQRFVKKTPLA